MAQGKKILFTSHTANFAKYNQPFMQDLREKGNLVHYASAGEEEIAGVDGNFVVDFVRSPLKFWKHLKAYRQLVGLMKAEKYDLIHTHTPVGGVVTRLAAFAARAEQRKRGEKLTPVIYTAHGLHFYRGAPLVNWILYYPVEKFLSRGTDAMMVINHEDEELARRKFAAGRVERLEGVGVDLRRFRPAADAAEKAALRAEFGLAAEDFVVVYIAELNRNKDQEFILRALPELRAAIPCLKVLFVGDGARRGKLEKLAGKLGVSRMVRFLGYRRDVERIYRAADVVTSVSRREGLGLGVVEGMASGLPVVARDNRGHREIWRIAGNVGYLVKTEAEFAAALAELAQNPARRAEIGMNNAKLAEKFSLERAREKMGRIYEEILG